MTKVILDPGHGSKTNRYADGQHYEGTVMWHLSQLLADKLRQAGISVVNTRSTLAADPALWTRGQTAKGADLFVSLHSNAASASSAVGVSVFYSIKRPSDKPEAAQWCSGLAKLIRGGTKVRGALTRKGSGDWDYYTVIQSAVAAGCPHVFLVEHGFHSNPDEAAWLTASGNLDRIAELEADLICKILGVKTPEQTTKPSSSTEPVKVLTVNTPADTLNVRVNASASAIKIGELEHGTKVEVIGDAGNGWLRIRSGSLEGWVNGKYLAERPDLVRLLSSGCRGDDVKWLQQRLTELGYSTKGVDGIYGANTETAVRAFQKVQKLSADGIVGPLTWAKL